MMKKIMCVDDDVDILRGLRIRLESLGYRSCLAMDGVHAVAMARAERPDLILLDLGLPGADGYEVMERLREFGCLEDTPVVVLSGRQAAFSRQRAINEGAIAFLEKPVTNERLVEAIERALRMRCRRESSRNGLD